MPGKEPIKVGIIGCGGISRIYMQNIKETFSILELKGCSDLIEERSRAGAEQFGCKQMTNEEILGDPEIQIVVNLTYPDSHYEVTKAALLAGKHVHTEKMIATAWEEGVELVNLARERNLRLSAAPDTFLGGGYQTMRKIIDSGMLGTPLYVNALAARGYHHVWEGPDPYRPFIMMPGGGIPFDMGGYYLHAIVNLIGGIDEVMGLSKMVQEDYVRLNPRHPQYKESLNMDTPTLLSGTLSFECGAYGSLTLLSDAFGEVSKLEIYGTEGTLICHDPNYFYGEILLIRKGDPKPYPVPLTHGYGDGDYRGIGIADLAWSLYNGRAHRCSADLGLHAFEVIHGIIGSSKSGTAHKMTTACERPAPLPSGYFGGTVMEASLDN